MNSNSNDNNNNNNNNNGNNNNNDNNNNDNSPARLVDLHGRKFKDVRQAAASRSFPNPG